MAGARTLPAISSILAPPPPERAHSATTHDPKRASLCLSLPLSASLCGRRPTAHLPEGADEITRGQNLAHQMLLLGRQIEPKACRRARREGLVGLGLELEQLVGDRVAQLARGLRLLLRFLLLRLLLPRLPVNSRGRRPVSAATGLKAPRPTRGGVASGRVGHGGGSAHCGGADACGLVAWPRVEQAGDAPADYGRSARPC